RALRRQPRKGAAGARGRQAPPGRSGRPRASPARPALRRRAAASRHSARARQRSGAGAGRRAHRQSGHAHQRRGDGATAGAEPRRHHRAAGDPRGGHRGVRRPRARLPRRAAGPRRRGGASPRRPHAGAGDPRGIGGGMSPRLVVESALLVLRVNLLRTLLTMLGVIIGVGAVIAMVSVGAGAQARVAERIQSLGSNLVVVRSGAATQGAAGLPRGARGRRRVWPSASRAWGPTSSWSARGRRPRARRGSGAARGSPSPRTTRAPSRPRSRAWSPQRRWSGGRYGPSTPTSTPPPRS